VGGIVLTMFDGQAKLSTEVVNELRAFIDGAQGKPLPWAGARIFDTRIRRNIKLAECPSFGKTIIGYDPASNGAADYRALAAEVMAMSEPVKTPEPKIEVSVHVPNVERIEPPANEVAA
jgi:chromosome partitioning protein